MKKFFKYLLVIFFAPIALLYYGYKFFTTKDSAKYKTPLIVASIITIIGGIGTVLDDNKTEELQVEQVAETQEKPTDEEKAVKEQQEEKLEDSTKEESKETEEDDVSTEFKNAYKKGKNYAEHMHMSKDSVYEQLTSEYGEGFEADAAQYAVDKLADEIDWNENALKKAKNYQQDMSMSRSNIYEQLISEYGEQFTEEQAQYAIDHLPE
ncbi:Ltp family lipoprotein [Dolosigranulum pigrum]|uniref:Ltp family lipoprotein n=1 Tax=Dolosigranulum pigrum TaxID=29394 RepID=UPI001AD89A59|nr:Ltp family lipoprotein [Dolosigranulum pigrum]QTJ59044.1 hypothetical protein FE336_07310 [Dolosigranulum pigrum]